MDDGIDGLRAQAGHPKERPSICSRDLDGEAVGVGERPFELRVSSQRQVARFPEDQLLRREDVPANQILGLVEPILAKDGRLARLLHWCVLDRTEGSKLRMMDRPVAP